ncbi:HEPN domain-containing protein [Serratia fonticola]|uniref:HEPN domain-containing protein n=1 Tax=Serratia fonticola TaxID=47917 RepID=UPI00192BB9FC|nr:HEPN domain-containing protein [Serratia fonticola]MBL5903075.1 hypothetical protein [Serratia fonticola]
MKLEFLVLIKNDDSFCNSKKAFIDFLKVDSSISITGQKLTFKKNQKTKNPISVNFRVETKTIPSNAERYFLVLLENKNESLVDEFSDVGDKIKEICKRINPTSIVINILWDDVGRHYAYQAYPLINDVENVMRKLISKFMLINVGMEWSKETIHPELAKKIKDYDDDDVYLNDLYKLDFINLSDMLFKKKRDISLDDLDRVLANTTFKEEDTNKILKFLPRSNWEKFFSNIIGVKAQSLEDKWKLLYKLRNKVAHNRSLKKEDFEKIKGLTSSVNEILKGAIDKLGEIDLDAEDRELIIHSFHTAYSQEYGLGIEKSVAEYFIKHGYSVKMDPYGANVDMIAEDSNGLVAVEICNISTRDNFKAYMIRLKDSIDRIDKIKSQLRTVRDEIFIVINELSDKENMKLYLSQLHFLWTTLDKKQVTKINFSVVSENGELEIIETPILK